MADSLAILPRSMGQQPPGSEQPTKHQSRKFLPGEKGGLLTKDPHEAPCPYTFSDSPAYVRSKKAEEAAKRAQELEGKDETRGFLRSVEEFGHRQKWDEALQLLDRRTAVPSGLFLVTRAVLRWRFCRYHEALQDVDEALQRYGSSAKAGPLASAFSSFMRICLGSEARDRDTCTSNMRPLVVAWEDAERVALRGHTLSRGLFHPREAKRLSEPSDIVDGVTATDGVYVASPGVKIGYVFLKNDSNKSAPVMIHFHGANELAADFRTAAVGQKFKDIDVHLLVVDYRGYGWSGGEPSLATFLCDAEHFAVKLPEVFLSAGLPWPCSGGVILCGRSLGAQVAIHLATIFPTLFRALVLESAVATSATGDRLGKASERAAALQCWGNELEKASLEVLSPLSAELWTLSALEKIRAYEGRFLVIHGMADEVPYDGSESLHAAARTRNKELVLLEDVSQDLGSSDKYWTSLARFALKVTLDDHVPSIGPVQHFCAVCQEKAESKCGQCQKVWYCGRKHQMEHWKAHKVICSHDSKPKQPAPEGEACVVAVVDAEFQSDADVSALENAVTSAMRAGVLSTYISWHATTDVAIRAASVLRDLELRYTPHLTVVESSDSLSRFQHFRALSKLLENAPPHAWVSFLRTRELWSPGYVSVLMPMLRKAAVDAKTVALSFSRRATWDQAQAEEGAECLTTSAQVTEAITAKIARASDEAPPQLRVENLVVKIKVLQSFLEAAPVAVLDHELCEFRFVHTVTQTWGKRVQAASLPDEEWMRWVESDAAWKLVTANSLRESDSARAQELFDNLSGTGIFTCVEQARLAVGSLRSSVERRIIQLSGGTTTFKDLRSLAVECRDAFVKSHGLEIVVGLQKWAKDFALDIAESAATAFAVTVTR